MATVCVGDDGDDESNIARRRGTMAMATNPSTATLRGGDDVADSDKLDK
jgi:hypothetical protein